MKSNRQKPRISTMVQEQVKVSRKSDTDNGNKLNSLGSDFMARVLTIVAHRVGSINSFALFVLGERINKSLGLFNYLIKLYASWHCGWCLMCSKWRSVGRLAYPFSIFPNISTNAFTQQSNSVCKLYKFIIMHQLRGHNTLPVRSFSQLFSLSFCRRFTTWVYREDWMMISWMKSGAWDGLLK